MCSMIRSSLNEIVCAYVLVSTLANEAAVSAIHVVNHHDDQIVFYDIPRDYWDAEQFCNSNFMHLLDVTSEEIFQLVKDNIDKVPINLRHMEPPVHGTWAPGFWTAGRNYNDGADAWRWSDMTTINMRGAAGFQKWFGIEPDGAGTDDFCLNLVPYDELKDWIGLGIPTQYGVKGKWKDDECKWRKYFICQGKGECPAQTTESGAEGEIRSPGYPWLSEYKRNLKCRWVLAATETSVLFLQFVVFGIEITENCEFDYLEISDGLTTTRYCGTDSPGNFTYKKNETVVLTFITDDSGTGPGFEATWQLRGISSDACSGENKDIVEIGLYGLIQSPNFPRNYRPDVDCSWEIYPLLNERVEIHVTSFDVRGVAGTCHDYVEIRSGRLPTVNRYCNSDRIADHLILYEYVLVIFHSNADLNAGGFEMKWWLRGKYANVCNSTDVQLPASDEKSGVIQSLNYPQNYNHDLVCRWEITAASDEIIKLVFADFATQPSSTCLSDYLQVADGVKSESYCSDGNHPPREYFSRNNTVRLVFITDGTDSDRGFEVHWSTTGNNLCVDPRLNDCHEAAICFQPNQTSYTCTCGPGYTGNGTFCKVYVAHTVTVRNYQFNFYAVPKSYYAARDFCNLTANSHLIRVTHEWIHDVIYDNIRNVTIVQSDFDPDGTVSAWNYGFWAGGIYLDPGGWHWDNGVKIDLMKWFGNEPNSNHVGTCLNLTPEENLPWTSALHILALFEIRAKWKDDNCLLRKYFICQRDISVTTSTTTTTTSSTTSTSVFVTTVGENLTAGNLEAVQEEPLIDPFIGTTIILGIIYLSYALLAIWTFCRNSRQDHFFFLENVALGGSTLYGDLNSYRYTISIYTGGGTDSTVRLRLIGSKNETILQYLQTSDGIRVFKSDSVNTFLLRSKHHLGNIQQIQFQREEKKFQTWFFKRILVRDLQKNKCWFFGGGVTFGVFETDVHISPMTFEEVKNKSFLLRWENMFKDRHSLFAVTPLTNWHHRAMTRLERVSVFYLTVFMIMSTSLATMIHVRSPLSVLGPPSTMTTLVTGLLIPFVVAPLTHCIMEIFRLTRRRKPPLDDEDENDKGGGETSSNDEDNRPSTGRLHSRSNRKVSVISTSRHRDSIYQQKLIPSSGHPKSDNESDSSESESSNKPVPPDLESDKKHYSADPQWHLDDRPLPDGQRSEDRFDYERQESATDMTGEKASQRSSSEKDPVRRSRPSNKSDDSLSRKQGTITDMRRTRRVSTMSIHTHRLAAATSRAMSMIEFNNKLDVDNLGGDNLGVAVDPNSDVVRPLPELSRFFAWFLMMTTIAASTVICIFQTMSYDATSTWDWWLSVLIGVAVNVFITEPIKIFLVTIIAYVQHPTLSMSDWLPPMPYDVPCGNLQSSKLTRS